MSRHLLDRRGATAMVVAAMVGVGIFLAPPEMAAHVPSAPAILIIWLLGGFSALGGALAYAAWGRRLLQSGGDVGFHREAFGPSVSFATSYLLFFGAFCGSIATLLSAVATYQLPTVLGLDFASPIFGLPTRGVGLGLLLLFVLAQWGGIGPTDRIQRFFAWIPLGIFSILAIGVLLSGAFGLQGPTLAPPTSPSPEYGAGDLLHAYLAAHFAFAGFGSAVYVVGDLQDPKRDLRPASATGVLVVLTLYLLLVGALLVGLGTSGLASAGEAGSALASRIVGPQAGRAMSGLIGLGIAGTIHATLYAATRVAGAMAVQGQLPRNFSSGPGETPRAGLVLIGGFCGLLLWTESFSGLLELTTLTMVLIGGLTVAGLFRVLLRDPGPESPLARIRKTLPGWDLPLAVFHLMLGLLTFGAELTLSLTTPDRPRTALIGLPLFFLLAFFHASFGRIRRR